jgi:hypothetical protein
MTEIFSKSRMTELTPTGADPDAGGTNPGGFVARLGGISLLDLIQFECLRGGQRILRVSSRGQSGYLYFRAGGLVHAATAIASGVTAVREMLGWQSGSVESGMGGWPTRESITAPWQDVLAQAAGDSENANPPALGAAWAGSLRSGSGTSGNAGAPGAPPLPTPPAPTVVLAPSGELIEGGSVHGLPEAAAYAAHMAELIGGFMGFDRFCALEVSYGGEQLLVGRAKTGNLLARREKDPTQLDDLRREVTS